MAGSKLMCCGVQSRAFSLSSRAASAHIFKDVEIYGGMRTSIGSFGSKLKSVPVTELGSTAIYATLEHARLKPSLVQERCLTELANFHAFVGVVLPADAGQAPARQAVLPAGLDVSTVVTAVNKMYASDMKSTMIAAERLQLGLQDFVIGAGMESMSLVLYFLKRGETPFGDINLPDGVLRDGLVVYSNLHMEACTDKVAKKYGTTREEQDEYGALNYRRAAATWESGLMAEEIVPVDAKEGKKEFVVEMDEEFERVNYEKLPKLKTAFLKCHGTITAGNTSTLSDGAAAVLLARAGAADQHHIPPIAKILALGDAATEPKEFSVAPTLIIPEILEMAGLTIHDIPVFGTNEAFAGAPILAIKKLNLDPNKVSMHGGAVSLSHLVGMSGARIIVHLLHALKSGRKGLAAICDGGGGTSGMIIEKL